MTQAFSLRAEFLRHASRVVPPVLGMSVVLGLFNASEWTMEGILPKVQTSLGMGHCAFHRSLDHALRSEHDVWLAGRPCGRVRRHCLHALVLCQPRNKLSPV
jgi:hypothetical protein